MCCCPLLVGIGLGLASVGLAFANGGTASARVAIGGMAGLSLASIVWSLVATKQYENDWKRKHPGGEEEAEIRYGRKRR
jgi:hypothetical protein